jgi:hypothetical protein
MLGTVFFQDSQGIDYNEFIQLYKDDLKGKEGIYVVQTNLEQDNMKPSKNEFHIQTRSGVKRQGGPVVKVGKTTNFASRFAGYASHNGGSRSSRTDQGGIRILYVSFLNKKKLFTTGKSYTDLFEMQLHRMLKEDYGLLPTRGIERYALTKEGGIEVLFEKINSFTPDVKEDENQFIRRSERLGGERLMWLTRDLSDPNNENKFHIEFHKDFDTIIEKYKKQIEKRFTPITDGMIKPHIVKYLDKIKYVVSTIKEQTTSEIGQNRTSGNTLGEVDSLARPPVNTVETEEDDNFNPMTTFNSPSYLSVMNSPSSRSRVSGDESDEPEPSPELAPLFLRYSTRRQRLPL